jgi:hypothetical protein
MKVLVEGTIYRSKHVYVRSLYSNNDHEAFSQDLINLEFAFPKFEQIPMNRFEKVEKLIADVSGKIPGAIIRTVRDARDRQNGTFHIVINYSA